MKKQILPLLILFLIIPCTNKACSCDWNTFCSILHEEEDAIVIKGVVSTKTIQGEYQAVYIDIIEEYRDDYGVDTKKLKILGSEHESWCDVNVHKLLKYKDTIYLGIKYINDYFISNPDSIKDKSTFVFKAHLCGFRLVTPISEEVLGGNITGDRHTDVYINEYPKKYFERDLVDCNFSKDVIKNYNCEQSDYIIYPNPVSTSTFKVKTILKTFSLDNIEVYNMQGVLVHTYYVTDRSYRNEYDVSFLPLGTYIFRIHCNDKVVTQKIVILK